jgi:hypothetical protein
MKKILFVITLVVLAAGMMLAQSQTVGTPAPLGLQGGVAGANFSGNVTGELNYIPNYDVMGAHENGGRGCAGCHAPHNGAKGNGGTATGSGAYASAQGGLWGEDTSAIMTSYSAGITFNGGNSHHSGVLTWGTAALSPATAWTDSTYTGVATCLSCHDGAVSIGAMLSGVAYEQAFGLLNGAAPVGFNTNRNGALSTSLYGPNAIPTFLGGTTGLGYNYQHPVGQTANLGAALGTVLTKASYGLAAAINGTTGAITIANVTPQSPYANFAATYYPGAMLAAVSPTGSTNAGNNFVVCTTCHNQHNMSVYGGGQRNETVPAGVTQVRTIFFVNGGYNPGAPYDPTHVPSTMRFCQQCHFSFASEYFGATNVGTAY